MTSLLDKNGNPIMVGFYAIVSDKIGVILGIDGNDVYLGVDQETIKASPEELEVDTFDSEWDAYQEAVNG